MASTRSHDPRSDRGKVFTSNFTWSVIFWHYAFTDAAMSGHETGERVWGDDMREMAWLLAFDLG